MPSKVRDTKQIVLSLWRDVELFNLPDVPSLTKPSETQRVRYIEKKHSELLPWHDPELQGDPRYMWVHRVYLGVTAKTEIVKLIVATAVPGAQVEDFELERLSGETWLAAFTVDETGAAVPKSYLPASFTVALARLRAEETLEGITKEIATISKAFDDRNGMGGMSEGGEGAAAALSIANLGDELDLAKEQLGDATTKLKFDVLVKSGRRKRPKPGEDQEESDLDFLNSYFLDDLDRLIDRVKTGGTIGEALNSYLGTAVADEDRVDVLQSRAMGELILARRLPTGRWPSPSAQHLSLAQQAAVFESLERLADGAGMVSINGPPGTGKSTLLYDIIAEVVVKRARRIAALKTARSLLADSVNVAGSKVYPLSDKVAGRDGIVVTSSNNTAVENITRDLPARSKIAAAEYGEPKYFANVAQTMFTASGNQEPAWGMVAAPLGNSNNRTTFVEGFFRGPSKNKKGGPQMGAAGPTMKDVLEEASAHREEATREWFTARDAFLRSDAAVTEIRSKLISCERALQSEVRLESSVFEVQAEVETLENDLNRLKSTRAAEVRAESDELACAQREMKRVEARKEHLTLALSAAESRLEAERELDKPTFWERWARAIGMESTRHKSWRERVRDALAEKANAAQALSEAMAACAHAAETYEARQEGAKASGVTWNRVHAAMMNKLTTSRTSLSSLQSELDEVRQELQRTRADGITLPDRKFWQQPVGDRHRASLWVNNQIDHARSVAFLAALRLQEATIRACAGPFIANLRAACFMLAKDSPSPLDPKHRSILWDSIFFCVPVVSTTLASFDRLFEGMEEGSLGWVLFDEAGQATPQSAAGALWRARRALVVGDPLQIEPVLTVPGPLVRRLVELSGVDECWSPATNSAQEIADRTMSLGTWVPRPAEPPVWTGLPLRAHRRCASPMFEVANRIAYDGQMVQAAPPPAPLDCVLGDSAWYDVRGAMGAGHVVAEEMALLQQLFEAMCDQWPRFSNGRREARVYVISPFKNVATQCDLLVRNLGIPTERVACGTVHAFQGKEAEIVFIVLGSSPGPAGSGSRKWASSKPNLLNVALTRAKLRVYVLGDRDTWSKCPGFDLLADVLPVRASAGGGQR